MSDKQTIEAENDRLRAWLQSIAEVFDARSELFTSDEECAASLADRAKAALSGKALWISNRPDFSRRGYRHDTPLRWPTKTSGPNVMPDTTEPWWTAIPEEPYFLPPLNKAAMNEGSPTKERFLEFVNLDTGEVSSRVDVTGQSERQVERCMRGMLINIGDRWFVRDTSDG